MSSLRSVRSPLLRLAPERLSLARPVGLPPRLVADEHRAEDAGGLEVVGGDVGRQVGVRRVDGHLVEGPDELLADPEARAATEAAAGGVLVSAGAVLLVHV
jgi:hypothetical protein